MKKNQKKVIKQKNPTKKIDFSDVLSEVTDAELIDYYSKFSTEKLKKLLFENLPNQDRLIIEKILKK